MENKGLARPLSLFFVLILLLLSNHFLFTECGTNSAIIPAKLVKGGESHIRSYVISIYVGAPPELLDFEVTFKHGILVVYRDQYRHSMSFDPIRGGSELIYFGDQRFRINMNYDPQREIYPEHNSCAHCHGMIGLGRGSFFWQIFPDASFTSASVTAGDFNSILMKNRRNRFPQVCRGCLVHCDSPITGYGSLCDTGIRVKSLGNARNKEEIKELYGGKYYGMALSVDSPITYLPRDIYDYYIQGKNLYSDYVSDWGEIVVSLDPTRPDESFTSHAKSRGLDVEGCNQPMEVGISPEYLVSTFESSGIKLLILPNEDEEDDTIRLGNTMWNHFIFYISPGGSYAYVQSHSVHASVDPILLTLFVILFVYLARWKLTSVDMGINTRVLQMRTDPLNLFFLITGPILSGFAIFFPTTMDIMADFPVLYAISVAIWGVSILLIFLVTVVTLFYLSILRNRNRRRNERTRINRHRLFQLNMMRNVAQETVLMIGLWVSVLDVREEGISTFLTALANVYIVYNITAHTVLFLLYSIFYSRKVITERIDDGDGDARGRRIDRISFLWVIVFLYLVLLLGFQGFASYVYFVTPVLFRNSQLYTPLILPTLILVYVFIIGLAIFIVTLMINRAIKVVLIEALQKYRGKPSKKLLETGNKKGL